MIYRIYSVAMIIEPTSLFAALAHETRLRCLLMLCRHEELCVCELTNAIGASQPHMSRHLAQLREVGLVSDRREGLWVYYRLKPGLPGWVGEILQSTLVGARHRPPFVDDLQAIACQSNRSGASRCA